MIRFFLLAGVLALALSTQLSAQSYTTQQETLPCLNKKFTIVAHIFKDSTGTFLISQGSINSAVDGMNQFFKPIGVSFEVCEFRYHDNFQFDIMDVPAKADEIRNLWHDDYRVNIYFITWLPDFCGMAYNGISDPTGNGIIIRKNCASAGTLSHEMGHLFGLAHTFSGNGTELVNGDNCETEGDQICDTPADPYIALAPMEDYVKDCRFIYPGTDANGEYYIPDLGNIMSYYQCGACGFTWGQLKRMADNYLSGGVKLW
ncbi:MAG: hypothetical protein IPL65_14325 [Lewinellaceae bacterium]|nr:hypothetical protein [Lewinellaceae bacterium]